MVSPGGGGDNLVVFYSLSTSEIWPDKRMVFGGSGLVIGGLLLLSQVSVMFIPGFRMLGLSNLNKGVVVVMIVW